MRKSMLAVKPYKSPTHPELSTQLWKAIRSSQAGWCKEHLTCPAYGVMMPIPSPDAKASLAAIKLQVYFATNRASDGLAREHP